jgi:hypothetical protein
MGDVHFDDVGERVAAQRAVRACQQLAGVLAVGVAVEPVQLRTDDKGEGGLPNGEFGYRVVDPAAGRDGSSR